LKIFKPSIVLLVIGFSLLGALMTLIV
jgi:hypothetical protein